MSTPVLPGYGPAMVPRRELLPLPEQLLRAQRVAARAYDAWHDAREDPEFEDEPPWLRYEDGTTGRLAAPIQPRAHPVGFAFSIRGAVPIAGA